MALPKRVLIVTTDSSLAYQPTILNLYAALKPHFDTQIISFCYYNNFIRAKGDIQVNYLRIPKPLKKSLFFLNQVMDRLYNPVISRFNKSAVYRNHLFKKLVSKVLARQLKTEKADAIIAVDFQALVACQKVYGSVDFLSLEIYLDDPYRRQANPEKIRSVIISSEERYAYLFGDRKIRTFIIQNAPNYKEYTLQEPSSRTGLLWAGTLDLRFGFQYVIEFIVAYPEYSLTLKGPYAQGAEDYIHAHFQSLLDSGRLIINKTYLENDAFVHFISGFRIAFCFYDWDLIKNNINYYLGNAGRLFMHFAASVPTIACDIPGLKSVREFDAGRLISDYKPITILNALQEIEADYAAISKNCLLASAYFSFDKNTLPLIDYLQTRKEGNV